MSIARALPRLLRHWLVLPVAFFLVGAGWAVTSPVGSAPDDDYHLASIWCARGDMSGHCMSAPDDPSMWLVPIPVARASECFRFKPAVSAACADEVMADEQLTLTDRVNVSAGLYPPVFYAAMSPLAGDDVERSVIAMRLLNVALGALLLAALLRLTPVGTSSAASVAMLASLIPLGISIIGSTNPSSWTILGIGTVWAFAWAWLRRPRALDRRGVLLLLFLLLSSAMAIGSRVDASAYLVLALLLAITLNGWRASMSEQWRVGVLAAVAVIAVVAYLTRSPVELVGVADAQSALGEAEADLALLLRNASDLPQLWSGIVGNWPLGWYDVVMPGLVPVAGVLVVGMLVMRGLSDVWPRKGVVVGLSAAALVVVPLYFLQSQRLVVGEMVQPRYLLPLLTLFLAMTLLGRRAGRPLGLPVVPAWVIGVSLSLSAVLAFWVNAHRYMHGNEVGRFDFAVTPTWEPFVPLLPTTVVVAAATVVWVAATLTRATQAPAAGVPGD